MPHIKCLMCKEIFYAKPYFQRLGQAKYCSLACRHKSQITGRWYKCHVCEKQAWRTPDDENKSKSGLFFCGKNCSMAWKNGQRSGVNHHLWNGGTSIYRRLKEESGDKIVCTACGINDKRLLVVHHKDHNRSNNALSNLEWLCRNCHYLAHGCRTA